MLQKILSILILKATTDGNKPSKTKITTLATAILNFVVQAGWVHIDPSVLTGLNTGLAALIAIFMRDGVTASAPAGKETPKS